MFILLSFIIQFQICPGMVGSSTVCRKVYNLGVIDCNTLTNLTNHDGNTMLNVNQKMILYFSYEGHNIHYKSPSSLSDAEQNLNM